MRKITVTLWIIIINFLVLLPFHRIVSAQTFPSGKDKPYPLTVHSGPFHMESAIDWLHIKTKTIENRDACISRQGRNGLVPLKGKTIVLSPGHGGQDMGAEGNGVVEKTITLQIALKAKARLKAKGAKVIMVRTGDYYVPLNKRAAMAAKYHADIFVSIHVNHFSDPTVHGSTVYFNRSKYKGRVNPYPGKSSRLAKDIADALSASAGTTNRGVHKADYRVLRMNSVPSTLVETAFLSNKRNAAELTSGAWQDKAAEGIAKGIETYFDS